MSFFSLLAVKSSEPICFGPFCDVIKNSSDNTGVTGLIGSIIGKGITLALIVGGLFVLMYLIWGGIDWITSEGDKEKLAKAQKKMLNAIIGIIVIAVSATIFGTVAGDILGIVQRTPDGSWTFVLPQLAPSSP